jgi:hypothetical protein
MPRLRLHVHWLEVAFAVAWIGVLSVCWIQIKMSARFQSLLALGVGEPFPVSVIYMSVIYIAAITAILWAGLCIYLAITGGFDLRRLLRGLWVILIVAVPSLVTGIFLKGLPLPPSVAYPTLWLPLLFALWLSMGMQRRQLMEALT